MLFFRNRLRTAADHSLRDYEIQSRNSIPDKSGFSYPPQREYRLWSPLISYSTSTTVVSSGVRRPERGDNSPLSSAEVTGVWSSTTYTPNECHHADGVRLSLWTAATNEPIVQLTGDIWAWRMKVEGYRQGKLIRQPQSSGNPISSHLVEKQKELEKKIMDFVLRSISFILRRVL
jgi:hypothetical protein